MGTFLHAWPHWSESSECNQGRDPDSTVASLPSPSWVFWWLQADFQQREFWWLKPLTWRCLEVAPGLSANWGKGKGCVRSLFSSSLWGSGQFYCPFIIQRTSCSGNPGSWESWEYMQHSQRWSGGLGCFVICTCPWRRTLFVLTQVSGCIFVPNPH